jgi:hypothetical protein
VAALAAVSCGNSGGDAATTGGDASKEALTKAAGVLKEPIALIAGYRPYIEPADTKDKYTPKRHPVHDRAAAAAANEIRSAANEARQKIPSTAGPVGADVVKALNDVASACAEAGDDDAFAKCLTSVKSLDAALAKAETASGVPFPKVATATPTEASKKSVGRLDKVNGPGPAEKAYFAKRADAAATDTDVIGACQTAAAEVDAITNQFEKADEPIRVTAVTHKMNIDAQCHHLEVLADERKAVQDCKKTPKKPECVTACGKAKAEVEEGVPAAAFAGLEKDVADICK